MNNTIISSYQKDYSEKDLIHKIQQYSQQFPKLLEYVTLFRTYLASPTISQFHKILIIGALGYFICPFDVIPDSLFPFGFTDDFLVFAYVKS